MVGLAPICPVRQPRACRIKLKSASARLWRQLALLASLRKAVSVFSPVPDLPLPHVSHCVCLADGAADYAFHRALGDSKAAGVPDRPVCARRRPAVASEKDRHAHHGRGTDRDCHSAAHGALVRPHESLCVDHGFLDAGLRRYWLCRRLHQSGAAAQPGTDGARQAACGRDLPARWWPWRWWFWISSRCFRRASRFRL